MKTHVFIDGFNLYYGIRRTPYKWLDVGALCQRLLPGEEITKIAYYTARVKPRPNDPGQHDRQRAYLRALRMIPHLEIVYGHFLSHPVVMPCAEDPNQKVRVIKTEEKGSDVNLSVDLLFHGFRGHYEKAVIISNDSDLVRPIRLVRQELSLPVGVINPLPKTPSWALKDAALFVRDIRTSALKKCQFPGIVMDKNGAVRKPENW